MLHTAPLVLDGATGSCLMMRGMPRGIPTELWIQENPEILIALQKEYIAAGSQVIYAPTFQANRIAFAERHIDADVRETILALVSLSRQAAADSGILIAGDVGTCGKPLAPVGTMTYEAMFECYQEAISALAEAGVDYIAAETLLSAEEALVILDAAASVCDLPVVCSLTIEADGGLLFGGTIFDAAADIEAMGAAAVGCNCSVGPDQLVSIIEMLHKRLSIPVIAKPNAGMPEITADGRAVYNMSADDFAQHMCTLHRAGASLIGGCCGTTPDYIRAICAAL